MADSVKVLIEAILKDDKFKAGAAGIRESAKQTTSIVSGLKRALGFLSVAFVATKIIGAFKEIIKVGKEFEQAIANVAAVSGDAKDELAKLAREAGVNTVFSARQAADAMYFLASAGLSANDMAKVLTPTLNLAAAAQIDIAQATDLVVNQLKTFRAGMNEAEKFVDIMAKTVSSANTDMTQLGNALSFAGAIAAQNGIKFEDLNAVIATMADQGIKGARAGTQLRMALTKLIKPTSEAEAVLKKYGITQEQINASLHDPIELFKLLEPVVQNASDATAVFGVRQQNVIGIIKDGIPRLEELKNKIAGAGGAAKHMADIQLDTLGSQLRLLNSAWEEQAISISEDFNPALKGIVTGITNLIKPEKNLVQVTTDLINANKEYEKITRILKTQSDDLTKSEKAHLKVRQAQLQLDMADYLDKINDKYYTRNQIIKNSVILEKHFGKQREDLVFSLEQQQITLKDLEDRMAKYADKTSMVAHLEGERIKVLKGITKTTNELRGVNKEYHQTTVDLAESESIVTEAEIRLAQGIRAGIITKADLLTIDKKLVDKAMELAKTIDIESDALNNNDDAVTGNAEAKKIAAIEVSAFIIENHRIQMEEIDKLREQGLITEEEYLIRRREINAQYGAEIVAMVADFAKKGFDVTGQFMQNAELRLNKKHTKEQNALEKKFNDGLITEDDYNKQKEKLEQDQAIASAKLARKTAIVEKTAAIFQIAANTALGVMKSVAASPLTGGLPWSAIVTGMGIGQGIAAGSKPLPTIPSFRSGTESTKEGIAMLHDDERVIPKNLNIPGISNEALMQSAMSGMAIGGGGGGSVVNNTSSTSESRDNNSKVYNFYGIRDISDARNELIRTEGAGAF